MKYFEINQPYYALLKAENKGQAIMKYITLVSDDSEDEPLSEAMQEVPQDYAVAKFSRAAGEDKELPPLDEVLEELRDGEDSVLLIDGSLL
ncbi:hypothetical protein [Salibacterium halotolerans]|uniref:Uncharacterized protein n=1 Tax=Salibacterium halotolerans TaxID=1884432 RepID=A0A1I5N9N0_9BACI|nr:hypothetical protein [Salibacterium halotolerans]SFP17981.1 hypothetical protein SAMN05518683_10334 [Salibacterium halotolerans]